MVRQFKLINEMGQSFNLMNLDEGAFFIEPDGLGYSFDSNFAQIGSSFLLDNKKNIQSTISGKIVFKNYDKYFEFVNYVEKAKKLYLNYLIPSEKGNREYSKKIVLQDLSKTEKRKTGLLESSILFKGLSNWRQEVVYINNDYLIEDDIMRWDFRWDTKFNDLNISQFVWENITNNEAGYKINVYGPVKGLKININEEVFWGFTVDGHLESEGMKIDQGDVLQISTVDNELYYKNNKENLFQKLDPNAVGFNQFDKLKIGLNTFKINSETPLNKVEIKIYPEYISV